MTEATTAPQPSVFCVVLNWNGWRDVLPCVQSLLAQDYARLTVLLVDNASTDESLVEIRRAFPTLEIILAEENRGFAAGNNLGIRIALERGADFVWLLNNDTVAPPETLTYLVAAMSDAQTGIVGTVLYYMHNPAQVQAWGGGSLKRSVGFSSHFTAAASLSNDSFLTFASVLVRRQVFETAGVLDDGYFMYFEDSDFCFRARDAGWKLGVATDTGVLHKEGGSSVSNTRRDNPRTARIVTASGLRFLRRHGRPRWLAPWLFLALRLAKRAVHGDLAALRGVLLGVRDWWHEEPRAFQAEVRR